MILPNPSFSTDIQEIFIRRGCTLAGCHGSAMSGGLGLASAAESFSELVNVQAIGDRSLNRVQPGDFANSYLWLRVSDPNDPRPMPQGDAPLDNIDLANIMNWINAGAVNDQET